MVETIEKYALTEAKCILSQAEGHGEEKSAAIYQRCRSQPSWKCRMV